MIQHKTRRPVQFEITPATRDAVQNGSSKPSRVHDSPHLGTRQYARILGGWVEELHLVITNKLLGSGERLFEGTDNIAREYECLEKVGSETVTHVRIVKKTRI